MLDIHLGVEFWIIDYAYVQLYYILPNNFSLWQWVYTIKYKSCICSHYAGLSNAFLHCSSQYIISCKFLSYFQRLFVFLGHKSGTFTVLMCGARRGGGINIKLNVPLNIFSPVLEMRETHPLFFRLPGWNSQHKNVFIFF